MFEKLKDDSITLKNGDTLATRCTMVNYKGDIKNNTQLFVYNMFTFFNIFQ